MKILILAYYYPPCNAISAMRPKAFADYFSKNKYEVKVISRHWTGNEKTWPDYLQSKSEKPFSSFSNGYEEIFIPYKRPKSNKLLTAKKYLKGVFNVEIDTLQYLPYVESVIDKCRPDYLIVSVPPLNLLNLGNLVSRKYDIPLIMDFRDFQNEALLSVDKKLPVKYSLLNKIITHKIKNIVKDAFIISTATPPTSSFFKQLNNNTITVTNGFEEPLFPSEIINNQTDKFTLSVIGTLYPAQDISILISSFNEFLKTKSDVTINFIGVKSIKAVSDYIAANLPRDKINITHKIKREEALDFMFNSNILFYAAWKNYKGIYSGKIFEYLGARKNILIAPGDADVIEDLIKTTDSGFVANTKEEVLDYLELKYQEWKRQGFLDYAGKEDVIEQYSRESQIKKLFQKIKQLESLS